MQPLYVTDRLRSGVVNRLKRLDPALLLIPLIGLVAVWPFLTESLPSTDDGALHMRRLAEIERSLRHGVLPLRWAPDFAHGYGYPFFNFYASLSSYLAVLWRFLGLNVPQAIAAATVMAIWASGWGAYLLGKAIAGPAGRSRLSKGGLVAAAAFMYAPYQFYDSAYRGNLAETWALALLPWVLWAGRRTVLAPPAKRWAAIVLLALTYAALICTHNVYALISSPVLGLYLLLLWWIGRSQHVAAVSIPRPNARVAAVSIPRPDITGLLWAAAGVALGLALSAFFWLPAFGERGWTRFSTGLVDYRTFFLDVRELLALPPQVDLSLLNYYPPRSLNWGMLVAIGFGAVVLVGRLLRRVWKPALREEAQRRVWEPALREEAQRRVWEPALREEAQRRVWEPALHEEAQRRVWKPALQEVAFFAVVLLGAAFLTVRVSDLLWRTVPLLGYALIPWRFLGIASLAGSLVAGATIALLPDRAALRSPALVGACIAIALVVAAALPWTYATPVDQRSEYGVADMVGWEYSSKLIGTTAKNEFLPIWSSRLPPEPADPVLLTEADPIIARLDESSLPDGARIISAGYGLMRAELVIDTPRAFRALYKQLYFPGWRVTVDGRAVPPIATAPYGLLGFEVPAGRHRIVVRPATTPLRLAGNIVSALALAVVVAGYGLRVAGPTFGRRRFQVPGPTLGRRRLRVRDAPTTPPPSVAAASQCRVEPGHRDTPSTTPSSVAAASQCRVEPGHSDTPFDDMTWDPYHAHDRGAGESQSQPAVNGPQIVPWPHWAIIAALALLLLLVKEGWIDRTQNLFRARRFDPERPTPLPGVQVATAVNFGDAFTLHGYRLPRRPVRSGEPLRVDLYLGARHPPEARAGQGAYMAYARLVDGEGHLWSLPYNGAPEGHRPPPATTIWPVDAYGHWAYLVYTLPGTPPGTYWIEVGLFERDTWRGLNVLDAAGRIAGLATQIGPVEVARPGVPPDLQTLGIERPSSASAAPGLRYLGSAIDAPPVRAGDELGITLFWQAAGPIEVDYALRLTWIGEEGPLPLGEGLPLGRGEHPAGAWDVGEIVRSPHRLRVPASAPAGAYRVEALVTDQAGLPAAGLPAAGPIVVAEGTLEPTDRLMEAPQDVRRRVAANLGERVTLLSYDLPGHELDVQVRVAPGGTLPVALYWQARREMEASYKVFVQLVGAALLAQSDTIPANWQRPTTGWAPGEVVVDEHVLSIPADAPPGEYALIVGMYDQGTLQRLAVLDAHTAGDFVTLEGVVVE